MKRLLLACLLLFTLVPLRAETAADKITAGRAALAARDLPTAKLRFQEALVLNPQSQVASALLGFTRALGVMKLPAVQAAFVRAGVVVGQLPGNRWSVEMLRDGQKHFSVASDYNLSEVTTLMQTTVIPELERIRADFAGVTNPSFLLTLSPAEAGVPGTLSVDHPDLLMARAWLRLAEFTLHLGSGQKADANLGALQPLLGGRDLTLQRLFMDNPELLKPGAAAERIAAKAALLDAIQLYRQANAALHARPPGLTNRLFALDPAQADEEAAFAEGLQKVERSLNEFIPLGDSENMQLRLGTAFAADWSLRAALPTFTPLGFDYTTITDATVGGFILGLTREAVADALVTPPQTVASLGWEAVTPTPTGDTLYAYLALPSGKHLVGGAGGRLLSSDDGTSWTSRILTGQSDIRALAFGADRYVAATSRGALVSSDAGTTWRMTGGASFSSIVYAAGRFVGLYTGGGAWSSTNGDTWSGASLNSSALYQVVHNGSLFVAVGEGFYDNTAAIFTSPDGVTWTRRYTASTTGTSFRGVAFGGGKLVAVGTGANYATSSDGLTWTAGTIGVSFPSATTLHGVGYRNGFFAAVGDGGTFLSSPDGVVWTILPSGQTVPFTAVSAGPDAMYATGPGGVLLRWTGSTAFTPVLPAAFTIPVATTLLSLRAVDGHLYALGTGGYLGRSADGQTVTPLASGTVNNLWSMIAHEGRLYAVGNGGTLVTSTDGVAWQPRNSGAAVDFRRITRLNGAFFLTGASGMVVTSDDGITWTQRPTGTTATLYDIAYGNGRYVAVGNGRVAVSTDLVNWTVNQTAELRSVVFADGKFTTAGVGGYVARSTDGVNWQYEGSFYEGVDHLALRLLPDGRYCRLTTPSLYNPDFPQSTVSLSTDGNHWVRCPLGTASPLYSAEVFQGRLYVAGAGGQVLRSAPLPPRTAPALRTITPDTFVRQGDPLALVVAPNAEGATAYQWKKDGTVLPGATSPSLSLANLQPTQAGSYTLTATNAVGTTVSAPIVLTVDPTPSAPKITAPPQSQTINVGLATTLAVGATGTAPLAYQWSKDGTPLAGATLASLPIASVQPAHAGAYTVTVSNGSGSVTSAPARLTVDSNVAYTFTTLAGLASRSGLVDGVGPAARLSTPMGVTVDPVGNVYVADIGNWSVRKIAPDGAVTTIATDSGSDPARIRNPRGLALDPSGTSLYVADGSLRKITLATRAVAAITADFGVTGGPAVDAAGNIFVISGWQGETIYKVTPAGVHTLFAGSTSAAGFADGPGLSARFNGARGLAFDAAGNLYVADTGNHRIRKITPDGTVSTYAGQSAYPSSLVDGPLATATFYGPAALAFDAAGNLFVTEGGENLIRKISAGIVRTIGGLPGDFGPTDGLGMAARFYWPRGIAVDAQGRLYIADSNNSTVRLGTPSASPLAPAIIEAPAGASVAVGGGTTFSVRVSGVAPFTYQWQKDGAPLPGATLATLALADLPLSASGNYAVQVSNASGSAVSPAAALTVATPPAITRPPAAAAFAVGQPGTLDVNAVGSAPLAYQWLRNGVPIVEATGSSYLIPTVAFSDSGSYAVTVSNPGGSVTSAAAVVTAYIAPVITAPPVAQTVATGGTATFTVSASGNPAPLYQWRRDGVAILGATTGTLQLANVQPAEAGAYSVVVANVGDSVVSAGAMLTVTLPAAAPAITVQPRDAFVSVGGGATFAVTAVGNATLAYQWRKNGAAISGATAATLTLTGLQPGDAAAYSVVITNGAGSATSRNATLSIVPAAFAATHSAAARGYVPGRPARITTTLTYPAGQTGLTCQVLLPAGWTYVAGEGPAATTAPSAGAVDVLEWQWSAVPAGPLTLTYTLNVPAATTGVQLLTTLVTALPGPVQFLAQADPLLLPPVTPHSADTDGDFRLSLTELTRVIELYNTRNGPVRTGAYAVATATTEDGFSPDPARPATAVVTPARYHSADTNQDGRVGLSELSRVIELFNTRSGSTRTGALHPEPGTEDGFAAGP